MAAKLLIQRDFLSPTEEIHYCSIVQRVPNNVGRFRTHVLYVQDSTLTLVPFVSLDANFIEEHGQHPFLQEAREHGSSVEGPQAYHHTHCMPLEGARLSFATHHSSAFDYLWKPWARRGTSEFVVTVSSQDRQTAWELHFGSQESLENFKVEFHKLQPQSIPASRPIQPAVSGEAPTNLFEREDTIFIRDYHPRRSQTKRGGEGKGEGGVRGGEEEEDEEDDDDERATDMHTTRAVIGRLPGHQSLTALAFYDSTGTMRRFVRDGSMLHCIDYKLKFPSIRLAEVMIDLSATKDPTRIPLRFTYEGVTTHWEIREADEVRRATVFDTLLWGGAKIANVERFVLDASLKKV